MADPNHPGFASHRPPAPDDSLWPLKINDDIKIKRNPSAPDWHLPPARGVILARNDAYTYRVKKFEVGGTSNVENISVDRIVATKTTQNVAEAVRLRDECHTHGIPERGRGWCIKDKVKKGFDKQMSRLFKKIKGKTRRFLVLKGSTLFYFEDCELKVMKGKLQLIKGTCAPSGEMPVSLRTVHFHLSPRLTYWCWSCLHVGGIYCHCTESSLSVSPSNASSCFGMGAHNPKCHQQCSQRLGQVQVPTRIKR